MKMLICRATRGNCWPLVLLVLLPIHSCTMSVRVSNLLIGQTAHNLINSDIEDIYRIVYNSSLTTLKVTAWINGSTPEVRLRWPTRPPYMSTGSKHVQIEPKIAANEVCVQSRNDSFGGFWRNDLTFRWGHYGPLDMVQVEFEIKKQF
jgi:hypothetical protein